MLINIQTPVNLNINHLTDLRKLKVFMDDNNLIELYELIERINARVNNQIYKIKTMRAKVSSAAMISVKSKHYSVPSQYIGKDVSYQEHDSNLYMYFNTKLIAMHAISEKKLNYMPEHYEATRRCQISDFFRFFACTH